MLGVATVILDPLPVDPVKLKSLTSAYFVVAVATNVLSTRTHLVYSWIGQYSLGSRCPVLVMKPLVSSRRGVREYQPKGSQLRTMRWRLMESMLQSAAIFTISSLSFTVTHFVSPLGYSFCHYFLPPIVVRLDWSPYSVDLLTQ